MVECWVRPFECGLIDAAAWLPTAVTGSFRRTPGSHHDSAAAADSLRGAGSSAQRSPPRRASVVQAHPWISSWTCAESGLEQSAKSRPAVVGNVDHLGSTRRPGHQGDVCRTTSDGLGQSRQCGGGGAPIDRRRLDGHHQGVVTVASTHPGAAGAGLDPNLHAHWHPLDAAKYRDHFAQNRRLVAVDGGVGGVVRQQPHLPFGALEGLHRRFVFE